MTKWEELLAKLSIEGVGAGAGKITEAVVKLYFPTPMDIGAKGAGSAMKVLVKQSINKTIGRRVKVSPYCRTAGNFLDKEEYDSAIAELSKAVLLEPKYAWIYYQRGLVHLIKATSIGQPLDHDSIMQANADMSDARRLKPNDAELNFVSGMVYAILLRQCEWDFDGAVNIDRALNDIAILLERFPADIWAQMIEKHSHANAQRIRFIAHFGSYESDEAISACNDLLSSHPNDAAALYIKGASLSRKSEWNRALHNLDVAARLAPDSCMIREALMSAQEKSRVQK